MENKYQRADIRRKVHGKVQEYRVYYSVDRKLLGRGELNMKMKLKSNYSKIIGCLVCMMIFMCGAGVCCNVQLSRSAQKYVSARGEGSVKVGGVSCQLQQYKKGENYKHRLLMIKNGVKKVVTSNSECSFVTNGKEIYYTVEGKRVSDYEFENTIYRYDIVSGKKTKIIKGVQYTVCACNGRYLYYGINREADGFDVYALNLKNGKKHFMTAGVGSTIVVGKKVFTVGHTAGIPFNTNIYIYKENGTNKKLFLKGETMKIDGNKIKYIIVNKEGTKSKIYSCDLNGKHKKALTGWLTRIPDSYWK